MIIQADGLQWFKNEYPDDWIGYNHEDWIPEYLSSLLPQGGIFCDVGAHVGRYSLRLAAKARQVFAVEPFPQGLLAHLALNSVTNVTVFRAAAWSSNQRFKPEGWGGSTQMVPASNGPVFGSRLDLLLPVVPDLVKIDVEGAEADVLDGMSGLLSWGPTLFVEMHDTTYPGVDPERVYALLEKAGYGWKQAGEYHEQYYIEARPK